MKNISILILLFIAVPYIGKAQNSSKVVLQASNAKVSEEQPYKIVFQLASGDTLVHKSIMRQLGNITSVDPNLQIEVVCHGPGIDLIHKDNSKYGHKVKEFSDKGIVFNACEFTLKERQISKEKIMSEAKFVRSALLHIVKLQTEGWSYIKAGF